MTLPMQMKQKYKYFLNTLVFLTGSTFLNAGNLQTPVSSLNDSQMDTFILGKSFFRTPWVEAPSATTARDGLGPLFSANTCTGCHPGNGKGSVYNSKGHIARSLVTRLSVGDHQAIGTKMGFTPEPTYGSQLSINGVYGVPYEGKPSRNYRIKSVVLEENREVTLRKPIYGVTDLQYGALSKEAILSQRVPPALIGLGLLEQISDKQLLANEDINDTNKDGISGKANRVYSPETFKIEIGRFNWKANASKVKHQVAGAMNNDMGLTSPLYPTENCTKVQNECLESPKSRDTFDVPMKRLDAVTFYLKHLKVPQTKQDQDYKKGLKLFKQIACASCHIPTFRLKNGKVIHPFSDLLLHDMGKDLADGRVEFQAGGSEFRTAPLWGISTYKKILKERVNFLHDGRAGTLEEAILWHGGEAEQAKNNFIHLPPQKQKRLIDFLERL
jgi:CxxC motif-containing protein (DUF1111 family)